MKTLSHIFFIAASITCVGAGEPAKWRVEVTVLDEVNQPVPSAQVWVAYGIPTGTMESNSWDRIGGVSSTNGTFSAEHANTGSYSLGIHAQKSGFYPVDLVKDLPLPGTEEAWDLKVAVTMAKVGNPIPMFVKRQESKIQKEDQPVAFDLTAGDWVAPFGAGKHPDLFFKASRKVSSESNYEAELQINFPNPGDGIAVMPPREQVNNEFIVVRTAPEQGYEAQRKWNFTAATGPEVVPGYFLRIRTQLDENGRVKSALYAKVLGDINFYVGTKAPRAGLAFTYYLNPVVNSRNLEFDPKRNLLQNLRGAEKVDAP